MVPDQPHVPLPGSSAPPSASRAPRAPETSGTPEAKSTPTKARPSKTAVVNGIGKEYRDGKFAFTVTKVKKGVKRVGDEYFGSTALAGTSSST
ncbi:MAG TPA: hypothetical protein VFV01_18100 [Spirillospora sp.]|nr:hypothetical protein [Spirillospora sp.]